MDELKVTRKTASLHLKEIENIGILEGLKIGIGGIDINTIEKLVNKTLMAYDKN